MTDLLYEYIQALKLWVDSSGLMGILTPHTSVSLRNPTFYFQIVLFA